MKVLNTEGLIRYFQQLETEARFWLEQWENHRDIAGMRNAAHAIGRLENTYELLNTCLLYDESPPLEVQRAYDHFRNKYLHLHLEHEDAVNEYSHQLDAIVVPTR